MNIVTEYFLKENVSLP
uniref:Uncharacterized protein n=1 Tax=Arundo donax TaxID=35708 RepID=A0A0A9HNE9_ARUDO